MHKVIYNIILSSHKVALELVIVWWLHFILELEEEDSVSLQQSAVSLTLVDDA